MTDAHPQGAYHLHKFQVAFDGRTVAAVDKVGGLTRPSQVISWRDGGDPSPTHRTPGQADSGAITLERGTSTDIEFQRWANRVWDYPNAMTLGQTASPADFRKDITITLMNELGEPAIAWRVDRCWASEYVAIPDRDAGGDAVIIVSVTLQNEGWHRLDLHPQRDDGPGA